jgi:hypothetical protein
MPKLIQIAVDSQPGTPDWNAYQELFGLADDGSVWLLKYPSTPDRKAVPPDSQTWIKLPSLPGEISYEPAVEDFICAVCGKSIDDSNDLGAAGLIHYHKSCILKINKG